MKRLILGMFLMAGTTLAFAGTKEIKTATNKNVKTVTLKNVKKNVIQHVIYLYVSLE